MSDRTWLRGSNGFFPPNRIGNAPSDPAPSRGRKAAGAILGEMTWLDFIQRRWGFREAEVGSADLVAGMEGTSGRWV